MPTPSARLIPRLGLRGNPPRRTGIGRGQTLFSGIGLVGMYIGVSLVVIADPRVMQIVIGILILVLVIYTLFKKDIGLAEGKTFSKLRQRFAYVFAPVLGFYEGIFGSGNGIMFAIRQIQG